MRITIIIILNFFNPFFGTGQDLCSDMSYGIGVIKLNKDSISENKSIQFLNDDFTFGDLFYPKGNLLDTVKYNFLCYNNRTGYLELRCLKQTDSHYYVITNERNKSIQLVRKSNLITLQYWQNFILNASTICNRSKIFNTKNGKTELTPKANILKPVKIDNDWLMIKWNVNFKKDLQPEFKFGWIRWRKNEEILIKVIYLI